MNPSKSGSDNSEALLRRHAERLAQSMVEERHEVSQALFALLNEANYLRIKYREVNEYAERRGNNADGWQERARKAEAEARDAWRVVDKVERELAEEKQRSMTYIALIDQLQTNLETVGLKR